MMMCWISDHSSHHPVGPVLEPPSSIRGSGRIWTCIKSPIHAQCIWSFLLLFRISPSLFFSLARALSFLLCVASSLASLLQLLQRSLLHTHYTAGSHSFLLPPSSRQDLPFTAAERRVILEAKRPSFILKRNTSAP